MKKKKPPAFFDLARWGRGITAVRAKKIINPPKDPANQAVEAAMEFFIPVQQDNVKAVGIEKKPTFKSASAFGAALEKRGFKRLGAGAYSTVYGKDGYDRVVKVTRCLDDWIDYIQWGAKNGYAGNYVPKVYSWKKFATGHIENSWRHNTHFAVAIVERMDHTLSEKKGHQSDFIALEYLARPAIHHDNLMCQLICEDIAPGYLDFIRHLKKEFDSDDMYGKNLMVRKDGTFCVTDPVCGSIKTSATRLRTRDFASLAPATLRRYYEYLSCRAY